MKIILSLLCFLACIVSAAQKKQSEADYVNKYCKGMIEFRLQDKTRVDCLLDRYAIEYDWDKKFYEAIGQSLYYAMHTGRRAGIVLIVGNSMKPNKYTGRAERTITHFNLPIALWVIDQNGKYTKILK